MHYKLEIELLSAVNPGSGAGWAGVIDSDVVFDAAGLPYIPGRRLRGIAREMAVEVVTALRAADAVAVAVGNGSNNAFTLTLTLTPTTPAPAATAIEHLFGKAGQDHSAPLAIANAELENAGAVRAWLQWAQQTTPHLAAPDRIISTLTHVRQQTAIAGNGVAQEHSLRTTRVLNAGLKFVSALELADEKYLPLLALALQVTRSLGGKRNRGLGKIRCRLLDAQTGEDVTQQTLDEFAKEK